ncbi:MAG: hypothetical protein WD118_11200 [Phycisphaeraceae bacterium]
MSKRRTARRPRAAKRDLRSTLAAEAPVVTGIATLVIVYALQQPLFADLHNYPLTLLLFLWLFGTMLWCAFGAVRHADAIAARLGEPYGTLVLTLSVIVIEVSLIASVMLNGDNNPTLARDTMFATLMIVLNFMVGLALVIGALRHFEQSYNLGGARAYLSVIAALVVFTLILPNYMLTEPDPSQAPAQTLLFVAIPLLFYAVFIFFQTARHRALFDEPISGGTPKSARREAAHQAPAEGSLAFHVMMLVITLIVAVLLAKFLAVIVDFGLEDLDLPDAFGGLLVAILVLAPEGLSAFQAALKNRLQHAVNVCLGSALATIGLTVPAVLIIGYITVREVHLGLAPVETVFMLLTLFVSGLTFGGARTNVLQGIVHLALFIVFVALIFSP